MAVEILVLVLLLNWIYVKLLVRGAPPRLATKFSLGGRPLSWMSRAGLVRFAILFPIAISALILGLAYWLRFQDPQSLHVENGPYWQQPEHYAEACQRLLNALAVFMIAMVVMLALTWRAVVQANRSNPPRLGMRALLFSVCPFCVFLAWWCTWLPTTFQVPK